MRNMFSTKWWVATIGLLLLVALIFLSRVSFGHAAPLEQILSNKEFSNPAVSAVKSTTCDIEEFTNIEANFQWMVQIRAASPSAFSDDEYRITALNYIASAEKCFLATNQLNIQTNNPYTDTIIIDHGGVGDSGFDSDPRAEFVTRGRKWGLSSPFTGGSNIPGPGIPGGLVTYSYIANGVGHAANPVDNGGANIDVRTGLGVNACVQNEIATAFAAWSAIANIQFAEVVDNNVPSDAGGAVGDIRIGAHPFDGPSNTLAHAYFPPPIFNTIAGDMHFDTSEIWACTPGSGVIDIGIVALHEIGHSIGLNHEPIPPTGNPAVMNPTYDSTLTGLLLDDINGVTSIYGRVTQVGLTLTKTDTPDPVLATQALTYTLAVANNDATDVTGVVLTDLLDPNVTFASASDGGTENAGSVIWNVPLITAGQIVTRTLLVTVNSVADSTILTNNATVTATGGISATSVATTTVISQTVTNGTITVNACNDQNADGDCNDGEVLLVNAGVEACLNDTTLCQSVPATFTNQAAGNYTAFLRFSGASQGYYPTTGHTPVNIALGQTQIISLGAVYPVHPKGVAVQQELNKVYVAFQGPVITSPQRSKPYPFVAVIHGTTNEVLYTIPGGAGGVTPVGPRTPNGEGIGRGPWGVAVSGDGRYVYVGAFEDGLVSVINPYSDTVVANLQPARSDFQPTAPAVDPVTGRVHFPDYRGGRMVVLEGLSIIADQNIIIPPAAFSPFEMVVAAGVPSRDFVTLRDALSPNRFKYVGLDNPDAANLNFYNVDVPGNGTGVPHAIGLWQNNGTSRLYLTFASDPRPTNNPFPNPNKLLIYDLVGKDPLNPRSRDLGGDFAEVGLLYNKEANHMLGTFGGFAYNDSNGDAAACTSSGNGGTYVVNSGDTIAPGPLPSLVVGNPPLVSAGLAWVNPFEIAINSNKTTDGKTKIYVTDRCWNEFPTPGGGLTGGAVLILFDTSSNPTPTPTPTVSPTPSATLTPTLTATPTSVLPTSTPTITPVNTSTPTNTPSPTSTATPVSAPPDTPTPTSTATPTPTSTPTPTATPTPIAGAALRLAPSPLLLRLDQSGVTAVEAVNMTNLYAVEFQLTYDPTLVEVVDADPSQPGTQVAAGSVFVGHPFFIIQNEASNGLINFSATLQAPAAPFVGTGSLVEITWHSLSTGQSILAFSQADLSDQNGQIIPLTRLDGQLVVTAGLVVQGQAQLQGRSNHSGITVATADRQIQTGADGRFELEVEGAYLLHLTAPGYLSAQVAGDTTTISSSSTFKLDKVTLLAGDVTGDDRINIFDLAFMASRYGGTDPAADINRDGRVNIFDLALAASNYGMQGPIKQ